MTLNRVRLRAVNRSASPEGAVRAAKQSRRAMPSSRRLIRLFSHLFPHAGDARKLLVGIPRAEGERCRRLNAGYEQVGLRPRYEPHCVKRFNGLESHPICNIWPNYDIISVAKSFS